MTHKIYKVHTANLNLRWPTNFGDFSFEVRDSWVSHRQRKLVVVLDYIIKKIGRLPASVLTRGRAKSRFWRVERERRLELTWRWEARACGSPVIWILWSKFRDCCLHSSSAVGHPSSLRMFERWSNFRLPDMIRRAKFKTLSRRCMFFWVPFPYTARQ